MAVAIFCENLCAIREMGITIISISIVDFEWREKDTLTSQYGSS